MRASEFIAEAVGGDYIYHSVAQPNQIWNILRKGVIQPHLSDTDEEGGWEIPVISASRNQYYRFPYGGGSIQLVLDRNAIRQAGFKVMPFSYMQFYNQADGTGPTASNPMYKQETEERIYHPRGIGIPVKKPYVVGIQIRKELMNKVPEGLLKLINDSGLELTTMRDDPTNKGTFSRKLAKPPLNKKHYYKPKDVQIVARANDPSKYDLWVTSFGSPMPLRDSDKDNNGLSVDRAKELFKSMTGGNPRGLQSTIEYDQDITRDYYHNPDGTGNKDWVPPIKKTNNEITEAPLPADWDASQYSPGSTFKQRLGYALERAKRIGSGSSRIATDIEYEGRPTVLKIAKNRMGLAQNNVEVDILDDGYASQLGILIPMIDYDKQNREPTWIHTELAQKATEKQLAELMGVDSLNEIVQLATAMSGKSKLYNYQQLIAHMKKKGKSEEQIDTANEYANKLVDLSSSYEVELGDLNRKANWGLYQGKPVIIDAGANSNFFTQFFPGRGG